MDLEVSSWEHTKILARLQHRVSGVDAKVAKREQEYFKYPTCCWVLQVHTLFVHFGGGRGHVFPPRKVDARTATRL